MKREGGVRERETAGERRRKGGRKLDRMEGRRGKKVTLYIPNMAIFI